MNGYRWLTEDSLKFLEQDYLLHKQSLDERVDIIGETAESILKKKGFANKFKDYMKRGWFSLSTPVWTNFGTERGLPISCFGSYVDDTMESIVKTHAEICMMTKHGGGTAAYFGAVRGRGSDIKDNGKSCGSVHFAKMFDTAISIISQGNTRRGNCSGYWPIEHPDIEEVLAIKSEGHPIQDLSFGVCVSDKWMQQMVDGDKAKRRIWAKVLSARASIGYPYIIFTGAANRNTVDVYKDKELEILHSQMCTEIFLPTSVLESFVCCISSMNVLYVDEWKNTDAPEVLTYVLDAVLTEFIRKAKKIAFMDRAVRFAERHRALGIGWIGWHSYLQSKMIPFESMKAKQFNIEIAKKLKKKVYAASAALAEEYGEPELLKGYGRRNSTLCVTGDTKILTDRGWLEIDSVVGEKVNVWNGFEFSEVEPFETGESDILLVKLNNGFELKCTPEHLFKVVTPVRDSKEFGERKLVEVSASNLRVGDCMPRFLLPAIDNGPTLKHAYTNGAFTGDGSISNSQKGKYPRNEIRLYGKKAAMKHRLSWKSEPYEIKPLTKTGGIRGYLTNELEPKYFVPINYDLNSKLNWLAGIIDTDGCINSTGVSISTSKISFAKDIMFMLQTLGVHSRICKATRKGGYNSNNPYYYVVIITTHAAQILTDLGLKVETKRTFPKSKFGIRDCPQSHYIEVVSIEKLEKKEKTFCFTEPKRGTAIFNGVFTKQCAIAPTQSSSFILGQISKGIQPFTSNYYIDDLAKGKFTFRNPVLTSLLKAKSKDKEVIWDSILKNSGSVQHLDCLTKEEKDVFKTFAEISPMEVVVQASQRGKYIDQGQSLNLMINPKTPARDVNKLLIEGWKLDIKSLYYQIGVNAAQELSRDILSCTSCES